MGISRPYYDEVQELLAQIRGVTVTWKPREHNAAADRLASTAATTTLPATANLVLTDVLQAQISPAVRTAIAHLNAAAAPGFKDFTGVRSGGVDAFSKLGLDALQQRAGVAATTRITDALSDPKAQLLALRWVLRGLDVARAIRKVQVDAEESANTARSRRK